jgi:hypothetical protein
LPSLRAAGVFGVVRAALAAGKQRGGFGLVHFSVQFNHLHLIAEAEDRQGLSRGLQGLCVRIARAVNRKLGQHGRVFSDRYHARCLKSPRTVQLALRYVLLNSRKHAREAGARGVTMPGSHQPAGSVDSCSSVAWFYGFSRPEGLAFGAQRVRAEWARATGEESPVMQARSWLLRVGYQRAGPFDCDDTPGS